jgi:glycerol-3-phosphate dehydrogenase
LSDAFDLLVVGGGVNGVAIARDAVGRGLKALLVDKGDLAGATSSASSKLIHGGLRYLEHGEFRLVREGLTEREVLLRMAPHLVHPLRFILPHGAGSRPRWMVRAGLFLYDRLGGVGSLPASRALHLGQDPAGQPLLDSVRHGFSYADCGTDDARLTIVTARDAALRGAEIAPCTALIAARRDRDLWRAELRTGDGASREVAARVLVNAAGPWVLDVLRIAGLTTRARLRLVKGSHIVVPRLYAGDDAYLLQNDDRRVVFVIPFERDYSLIGTTELPFAGDPAAARITEDEIAYLCRAVARWFRAPPTPADIVWSYAGVRPLHEDRARSAAAVTRDYVFDLDTAGPPALSVFGGKLTTHRRLAEHALTRLASHLPGIRPPWTAGSILPWGADLPTGGIAELTEDLVQRCPRIDKATAIRLAASYGSDARRIVGAGDLGRDFGYGLSEAELRWLLEHEWAKSADDVLWHRTKLGLRLTRAEADEVADYLANNTAHAPPPPAPLPAPLPASGASGERGGAGR